MTSAFLSMKVLNHVTQLSLELSAIGHSGQRVACRGQFQFHVFATLSANATLASQQLHGTEHMRSAPTIGIE